MDNELTISREIASQINPLIGTDAFDTLVSIGSFLTILEMTEDIPSVFEDAGMATSYAHRVMQSAIKWEKTRALAQGNEPRLTAAS